MWRYCIILKRCSSKKTSELFFLQDICFFSFRIVQRATSFRLKNRNTIRQNYHRNTIPIINGMDRIFWTKYLRLISSTCRVLSFKIPIGCKWILYYSLPRNMMYEAQIVWLFLYFYWIRYHIFRVYKFFTFCRFGMPWSFITLSLLLLNVWNWSQSSLMSFTLNSFELCNYVA